MIKIASKPRYYEVCIGDDKIKYYWNFKLLSSSFSAITLFGRVYSVLSKDDLYKFLNTKPGAIQANHERIHILQARSMKLGYVSFYVLYIYYFLKNLCKEFFIDSKSFKNKSFFYKLQKNSLSAYYKIPFEQEAYTNQNNFEYYLNSLSEDTKIKDI